MFHLPRGILFEKWKNIDSQVNYLRNIFEIGEPALVNLYIYKTKLVPLPLCNQSNFPNLRPVVLQLWACLDLLELLVELSNSAPHYNAILALFDFPINLRGCPGRLRGQGMEEASDCAVGEPTREAR